jgi:hypothetical protein
MLVSEFLKNSKCMRLRMSINSNKGGNNHDLCSTWTAWFTYHIQKTL